LASADDIVLPIRILTGVPSCRTKSAGAVGFLASVASSFRAALLTGDKTKQKPLCSNKNVKEKDRNLFVFDSPEN